jgi:hypothetical protein
MTEAEIARGVDRAHAALTDHPLNLVAVFQHGARLEQVLPIQNRRDGCDRTRAYRWIRITSTAQSSLLG